MIVAQTVLTFSWTILLELVCRSTHDPLQDQYKLSLQLRRGLHCHGRCYLKSFAEVCMTHPRTTTILVIAEKVLTLSCRMRFEIVCKSTHDHSRSIKIYDYSRDDTYNVMDNATRNRLPEKAWATPGLSESVIIAEIMLELSWTMLFEIVCKSRHETLQHHQTLSF